MQSFKQSYILRTIIVLFISASSYSCLVPEKKRTVLTDSTENSFEIDSVLVAELNPDEYGMKNYVMALLKKGPLRSMIDSVTAINLQKAHMENIGRLADEGKLVVAGPFTDDTDLKGIYIFDVKTIEEAQKLCETDPAIKAGSLMMELHPWYGSAAMLKIPELHRKIAQKQP
ncbi:YCII-related protein [Emticicia oligotrophica DSM 17448]|uniref:YCII-related protein n=1 Tax=Emticicia oligotrophica (strain DSM 17448 / CIP 109782 / MTCC 6937 / GPTSA100-15) TaxID=929562 RepID=A0ABM5N2E6_EMTOG|nr:YciI family protein [Emticicia oligotrophica]AFK03614.1 YCII-related protein [Emticicia oligotrophica DSM 17448]